MNTHGRWDEQLIQIERSLVDLTKETANHPQESVAKNTVADRDAIDRALANITVDQNKIMIASKKAQSQNRGNSAVAWWAQQLAGKIKTLSTEYVALQNRKMWLRLLQARFAGEKKGSIDLEAKHLVDLAVRKKQLDGIEENLKRDLDRVNRERDRLKIEHDSIATADQNWDASGSFQARLGTDLPHSRNNPSAKALAECLNLIAVPTVHPEDDAWLLKSNEDLRKKSSTLAEQCRELAANLATSQEPASKISILHFKNTLEQVANLNDQVIRRIAAIKAGQKPKSRLKLMQKL